MYIRVMCVTLDDCRVFLAKDLTLMRCLHFPESRFDIVNRSSFWCKLLQYLTDLFSDFSGCLILAFTVERCIAAYMPTQFKRVGRFLMHFITLELQLLMISDKASPVFLTIK